MKQFLSVIILSSLFLFMHCRLTFAHREDYTDETLVFETIEKGALEPEYWFDFGHNSDFKQDFIRHSFVLEYGITKYWMIEGRATLEDLEKKSIEFDTGLIETRYRFFDEGTLPIDIAISGEVHVERGEAGKEKVAVEPRLILSKDFNNLNLTGNFSEEIPFNSSNPEFQTAFGFRVNATGFLRYGSEYKYNIDTKEVSLIPQVWFAFSHEITFKIGYSFGLIKNKENFGRAAIEVEF